MSSLTADCLLEVLSNLRNEHSTLHSCLLVNQLWCHQTIPTLWHNPFNKITEKKCTKIIQTYITCLEEHEIQELFGKERIQRSCDFRKPLFDYPRHLQIFKVCYFKMALKRWILFNFPETINNVLRFNVKFETLYQCLINLLFKRTKGFKILSVHPDSYDNDWLNHPPLTQNEFSLSILQNFNFKYEVKQSGEIFVRESSKLFNLLKQYARNIRHLNISINSNIKRKNSSQLVLLISQFIETQKNLEILEINDFWDPRKPFPIFDAIKSQTRTLRYLHIEGLKNFEPLLNLLIHCNNLEILNLQHFAQMVNVESGIIITLPKLNIRHLYSWDIPSFLEEGDMGLLLKMANNSLQTLALDRVDVDLLEIIEEFCPNIQSLSLAMFNASFPKLLPSLLCKLPLDHLYLGIFGYNFSDVLIELTNSIPSSVTSLYINFALSSQQLDHFLNEMKAKLRILGIIDKNMIKNDHLEIIIKYAKNHNDLKELHWYGNIDDGIIKENMDKARSIIPVVCFPVYNFLDSKINL